MSAKSIIARYVERNRSTLPAKEELRQHLLGVASEAGLSLTDEELDELTGLPPSPSEGRGEKKKNRGQKEAEFNEADEKSGNDTSGEI